MSEPTSSSYWEHTGRHQDLLDYIHRLIPIHGAVADPWKNRHLEKFRVAQNCYYDLFNNGLGNRAAEFRKVFGFGGTSIAKGDFTDGVALAAVETKMDEIIMNAAREQRHPKLRAQEEEQQLRARTGNGKWGDPKTLKNLPAKRIIAA